jgi:hypothetical protein
MKLILATCFLAVTSAFPADLLVSHMQDGDRIEVTHHSAGCFGNQTSYFEVARSNASYAFTQYVITWETGIPPKIKEKKTVGTMVLTKQDVAGLDGLLMVYRGKQEVFSETRMSVLLEYYGPTGRVKVEKLNGTGELGLGDRQDVVTFFALASRLQNKGIQPGG